MRHLFLTALLVGAGCTPDFDPATYLDSVRVVAVKAEPPEIAAGETTTLTALTFGANAPLEWALCTLAAPVGTGDLINTDCTTNDTADYLVPLGTGDSIQFTMPMEDPAKLSFPDGTLGFYVPIRVTAKGLDPQGQPRTVRGFYRLRYHAAQDPRCRNQNPKLSYVYTVPGGYSFPEHDDAGAPMGTGAGMCNGAFAPDGGTFALPDAGATGSFMPYGPGMPIPVASGGIVHLAASFEVGSDETYSTVEGDPSSGTITTRRELLTLSWYASGGSLQRGSTGLDQPENDFTADKHLPPGGGLIDLYVIARDERGGTDFAKRSIQVR